MIRRPSHCWERIDRVPHERNIEILPVGCYGGLERRSGSAILRVCAKEQGEFGAVVSPFPRSRGNVTEVSRIEEAEGEG